MVPFCSPAGYNIVRFRLHLNAINTTHHCCIFISHDIHNFVFTAQDLG